MMPKGQPASLATRHGNGAGGPGWGGPAKGASISRIRPGDPDGIQAMSHDADVKARRAARAADMEDVLHEIAVTSIAPQFDATRVNAAAKLHAIIEGSPMQRQDVTSKGERLGGYVVRGPTPVESATEWLETYAPTQTAT